MILSAHRSKQSSRIQNFKEDLDKNSYQLLLTFTRKINTQHHSHIAAESYTLATKQNLFENGISPNEPLLIGLKPENEEKLYSHFFTNCSEPEHLQKILQWIKEGDFSFFHLFFDKVPTDFYKFIEGIQNKSEATGQIITLEDEDSEDSGISFQDQHYKNCCLAIGYKNFKPQTQFSSGWIPFGATRIIQTADSPDIIKSMNLESPLDVLNPYYDIQSDQSKKDFSLTPLGICDPITGNIISMRSLSRIQDEFLALNLPIKDKTTVRLCFSTPQKMIHSSVNAILKNQLNNIFIFMTADRFQYLGDDVDTEIYEIKRANKEISLCGIICNGFHHISQQEDPMNSLIFCATQWGSHEKS